MNTAILEFEVNTPVAALTARDLYRLCRKRWIEVCELFCRKLGFDIEEMESDDMNFLLRRPGDETIIGYAKCYASWRCQIREEDLVQLETLMAARGIENGIIFTRGTFTLKARDHARHGSFDLITVPEMVQDIELLKPTDIQEIEALTREIRFIAPYCRRCGSLMEHRKNAVGRFWRCSRYPACTQTHML